MKSPMILATTALLLVAVGEREGAPPEVSPGTKAGLPAKSDAPAATKPAVDSSAAAQPATGTPPVKSQQVKPPQTQAPSPASAGKRAEPDFHDRANPVDPAADAKERAEYRRKMSEAEAKRAAREISSERPFLPAATPARSASKPSASEEPEGPIDPDNPGGPQVDPNNARGPQKKSPPQ